jgi:hypothetical protein
MNANNGREEPPPPLPVFTDPGWRSCLHCQGVYQYIEHGCSPPPPPRRARVLNRAIHGIDIWPRLTVRGYGYRLSAGFYWRNGEVEREVRPAGPRPRWFSPVNGANKAGYESGAEAEYWQRWRCQANFTVDVPKVALTGFRDETSWAGIRQQMPGDHEPEFARRYRVMGVAARGEFEVVIDLGFWIGPSYRVNLDPACKAAEQAIARRWWPYARAAFSWGEVKR